MENVQELVYEDLEPIRIPFRVKKHRYILVEASEDAARKYRNAGARSARMADGKVIGVDGIADVQSLLVSLCVFIPDDHGRVRLYKDDIPDQRFRVELDTVRGWSAKTVKDLFNRIKEISDLNEDDTEETLAKRIEEDTKRLNELRIGKASTREEGRKNSETGTETSSTTDGRRDNPSTPSWGGSDH